MARTTVRRSLSLEDIEAEFVAAALAVRGKRSLPPTGKALDILEAAGAVLRELGLEGFSVRRVAERADISLAALQYHFPSRADLVREMIEHRLNWYEDELLAMLRGLAKSPEAAFVAVIDWFLDDAASQDTTSFSFQFWALSDTDPDANKSLDRYMRVYREFLGLMVRRLNPAVSRGESLTRGAVLSSLIDGTMPITGHGKKAHPELTRLRAAVHKAALMIAKQP